MCNKLLHVLEGSHTVFNIYSLINVENQSYRGMGEREEREKEKQRGIFHPLIQFPNATWLNFSWKPEAFYWFSTWLQEPKVLGHPLLLFQPLEGKWIVSAASRTQMTAQEA